MNCGERCVKLSHSGGASGDLIPSQAMALDTMGFGSYDETEQENQQEDTDYDDDEAVNVHETDHDGSVDFESDADEDELLDKLQQMKD